MPLFNLMQTPEEQLLSYYQQTLAISKNIARMFDLDHEDIHQEILLLLWKRIVSPTFKTPILVRIRPFAVHYAQWLRSGIRKDWRQPKGVYPDREYFEEIEIEGYYDPLLVGSDVKCLLLSYQQFPKLKFKERRALLGWTEAKYWRVYQELRDGKEN